MKRFGIIGDPVAHSMSPRLFRAAYGGRYPYDLIEGSDFDASWERFLKDYDGINVTAPFKEKAAAKADILSPAVSRIGASNLIVKTSDGIFADNSDYHGVVLTLRSHNFRCGKALVIGCGGAGKAAAVALFDEGWDVTLLNRTLSRAEAFAKSASECRFKVKDASSLKEAIRKADLIAYTATAPFEGMESLGAEVFKGKIIFEANYRNPSLTGPAFKESIMLSGMEWLLYQAIAGYKTFTGEDPDAESMKKIIEKI